MAKLLLQPYFILLSTAIAVFLWIIIRYLGLLDQKIRRLMCLGISLLGIMWILSVPVVSTMIERSLYIEQSISNLQLDLIAVLAGGYIPGDSIEQDILINETENRVLNGVVWWKQNQRAVLVMSGVEHFDGRRKSRQTELMTRIAINAGVPESKIVTDTLSSNTFEHPQNIQELSGINSENSVGVVTSRWHMRRAIWSFQQYFTNVHPSPFASDFAKNSNFTWRNIIPHPGSLSSTTTMIHEWIGLLWYKLKR